MIGVPIGIRHPMKVSNNLVLSPYSLDYTALGCGRETCKAQFLEILTFQLLNRTGRSTTAVIHGLCASAYRS